MQLPAKVDYWKKLGKYTSMHPIVITLGMTRDRYIFLWRHFHVSEATKEDLKDSFKNDLNDNDEDLVEEKYGENTSKSRVRGS